MTDINLYKPGSVNLTIPFPTEWNELHIAELHAITKAFLTNWTKNIDCKVSVFIDMLSCRVKKIRNLTNQLNPEDVAIHGLPLVDFIFNENGLTKQPYSSLKLPGLIPCTVYGPLSDFNNITCGEFEEAEQVCIQFEQQPAHELLAKFAAILYRPKNTPYHKRNRDTGKLEPYKPDKLIPRFAKLQPWQLYTMYIWYNGCKIMLPQLFPAVYAGDGKEKADPMIFTKCIHTGAGPKNGDRDKIRVTPLLEFFFEMEQEAIKAKELQNAK